MNLSNGRRVILDQQSYGFIEYIPEIPCLRQVTVGFKLTHEVHESFGRLLMYINEKKQVHGRIGLLFDMRKAEPLLEQDLEWIAKEWQPQAFKSGVRYMAIVSAVDEVAEIHVQVISETLDQNDQKIKKSFFANENTALDWLREVVNH